MKTNACLGVLALLAMVTSASAAKLVVLAINSGSGTASGGEPPVSPAGAKGFLIGIENSADPLAPLTFEDLTFSGPNLVQRQAKNSFGNGHLHSLNVQTLGQALAADEYDRVAGSTFAANDSWWWSQAQNGLTLAPVGTGIVGGRPGENMTMTGSFNLSGNVPAGQWRTAYVVTTGDITVTGILTSGQTGFDALGRPQGTPGDILLSYSLGQFEAGAPQWIQPAGGIFANGVNWTEGSPPTLTDPAIFYLSATYTVMLDSAQTNDRLLVSKGDVTFALNGFAYNLTSVAQASVGVASETGNIASLTLKNGTLSAVSSAIGSAPGSNGHATVGGSATWTTTGSMQVGEGTGELTINPGGLVNVGGTLTASMGGTVTLAGGTLHAPAINISGGTLNMNSGTLQLAGGLLAVTSSGQVNGAFNVENGSSMTINGAGSAWHSLGDIRIGGAGTGSVSVVSGGTGVTAATRIGFTSGSHGSLTVDGPGSTWTSSDGIEVGSEVGQGAFTVFNGGKVLTTSVILGELSGAIGAMNLTGNGSSATLSDKLEVGILGAGSLYIATKGIVSAATAVMGRDAGSSGTTNVSETGSVLNVSGDLSVARGGIASLQIMGGGHVTNATARVGFAPGSQGTVTVDGAGSLWQNTDGIELGSEVGTGQLMVTGSGHVESNTATIGELAGAHGTATVTGAGSAITLSNKLEIGVLGSGELHVLAGGVISAATAVVARDAGSAGTVEVSGVGAMLSTTGALYVGGSTVVNGGTSTLVVTAGGTITAGTQLKVWQNGSITVILHAASNEILRTKKRRDFVTNWREWQIWEACFLCIHEGWAAGEALGACDTCRAKTST